ncbi:hypothetical protein ACE6H2_028065 [Prunus campanulata]
MKIPFPLDKALSPYLTNSHISERHRQQGGGLRCRLRHEDRRRRRLLDRRQRHLLDSRLLGHDLRSPSLLEKKITKEVSFHFPRLSDPDPNPNSKSSLLSRTSSAVSSSGKALSGAGAAAVNDWTQHRAWH